MPEEERHDSRPHFVIPYWMSTGPSVPGDDGDTRPVPSNVIWYLCPGIHASPYQPGEQLDVTVDVGNYGGANTPSIAQVTVWWADPTSGFVVAPDKLIGYRTVEVPPRGGHATTTVMSKVIPASAPPHICLLARVSHQYDRAGATVDPVNDRHWAQRNLSAVVVQQGTPFVFPFVAGNPLEEEAEFVLLARPASEERFASLAEELQAEPVFVEAQVALGESGNAGFGEGTDTLRIGLRAGEERRVDLLIEVMSPVGPGQFAAFEVSQSLGPRETVVGGLGLVVTTD
jgi:hypothetical protein